MYIRPCSKYGLKLNIDQRLKKRRSLYCYKTKGYEQLSICGELMTANGLRYKTLCFVARGKCIIVYEIVCNCGAGGDKVQYLCHRHFENTKA